jgi:hypothetical protein
VELLQVITGSDSARNTLLYLLIPVTNICLLMSSETLGTVSENHT